MQYGGSLRTVPDYSSNTLVDGISFTAVLILIIQASSR